MMLDWRGEALTAGVADAISAISTCISKSRSFGQSKKESKDLESIQSSTTPDPGYQWESDVTIRHHKREPRGQPLSSR